MRCATRRCRSDGISGQAPSAFLASPSAARVVTSTDDGSDPFHVGLPVLKDCDSTTFYARYVSDIALEEANMLVPASVTADPVREAAPRLPRRPHDRYIPG